MKIELKQICILTVEEMQTLNRALSICTDIFEDMDDADVYNAAKEAANGLEALTYLLEPYAEK